MSVDVSIANSDTKVDKPDMITSSQIRAARSLVGWTAAKLAEHSGLSVPTIQRAEQGADVPNMKTTNLLAVQRALESAGVVFLDPGDTRDGGPGVRLRS